MIASIHQFTVNCLFENYGSEELRCSTWSNIGVRFRIALNMSVSRAKQVGSQPQKRQAWTLWRYCVGDCGRPPKILILACHHSIPLVLDGPRVPRYLFNFPLVKKNTGILLAYCRWRVIFILFLRMVFSIFFAPRTQAHHIHRIFGLGLDILLIGPLAAARTRTTKII